MPRHGLDIAHEPIRALPSRLWLALAAVLTIVLGAATWGLLAHIVVRFDADGIVVRGPGPTLIAAPAAGSVRSVAVHPGEHLRAGQPVATVDRSIVAAPSAGRVVAVLRAPGDAVQPGSPLLLIDADGGSASVLLFVTSPSDERRLSLGQQVDVLAGGAVVTGQVASIETAPLTANDLLIRFGTDTVNGSTADAVAVLVELTADTPVPTLTPAAASIVVGDRTPYQLVFGAS